MSKAKETPVKKTSSENKVAEAKTESSAKADNKSDTPAKTENQSELPPRPKISRTPSRRSKIWARVRRQYPKLTRTTGTTFLQKRKSGSGCRPEVLYPDCAAFQTFIFRLCHKIAEQNHREDFMPITRRSIVAGAIAAPLLLGTHRASAQN